MSTKTQTKLETGIQLGVPKKKSGFERLTAGAYKPALIKQIKLNIQALSVDDLEHASMVRQHPRSMAYKLTVGLGGKNEYLQNGWHVRGEYLEYATIGEVLDGLKSLLDYAEQGEFDEALEALRKKRQALADKMVRARRVSGDNAGDSRFHVVTDDGGADEQS